MPDQSNLLLLTAILMSIPSMAATSPPEHAIDTSPVHLEHTPVLPPWAQSDLETNLQDLGYTAKIPFQAHSDDSFEIPDDSHALPSTAEKPLNGAGMHRRTLAVNVLSTPSATVKGGLRPTAELFQPSAPTELASQLDIDATPMSEMSELSLLEMSSPLPTQRTGMMHCGWLERKDLTIAAMLAFTLMAAGTAFVLRLLWRRAVLRRRRARNARSSLGNGEGGILLVGDELTIDDTGDKVWRA